MNKSGSLWNPDKSYENRPRRDNC